MRSGKGTVQRLLRLWPLTGQTSDDDVSLTLTQLLPTVETTGPLVLVVVSLKLPPGLSSLPHLAVFYLK